MSDDVSSRMSVALLGTRQVPRKQVFISCCQIGHVFLLIVGYSAGNNKVTGDAKPRSIQNKGNEKRKDRCLLRHSKCAYENEKNYYEKQIRKGPDLTYLQL